MTTIDQKLVRKGQGQPRDAVLQQARVLLDLATLHKTALASHGWDNADTTRFASNIQAVEISQGGHAATQNDSEHSTNAEQAAIDAVKAFLRRLRAALPRVLRDNPQLGLSSNSFGVDEPLRRSTPTILAYLIKIRSAVVTIDGPLKKYFGGKTASSELDAVKTALETADTEQEANRATGPVETQALYEAVGRLVEDIEDLIRAGKSAFDGDSAMRARFNKDLILRARRTKKHDSAESSGGPTPP